MARSTISTAVAVLLSALYHNTPQPEPQNYKIRRRDERNQADRLTTTNGISFKRIYQIIHGRRK